MRVAFVSGNFESLGLEYLSSVLRLKGHETELFLEPCILHDDAIFLNGKLLNRMVDFSGYIADSVKEYRPQLVGISSVTDYYQMYLNIARKIKERIDVPIVFGGVHPSSVPEKVLENEFVDYVCVGEGEYALLELVESLENGKDTGALKNIWLRQGKEIIKNEPRNLIEDLDILPFPDKSLYYKKSSFFRHTYTCMTSRGCFYNCSYCFNNYFKEMYKDKGHYFRRRTVDNVINELAFGLRGRNYTSVRFADDIFNYNKDWLRDFLYRYKKEVNKPFDCQLWLKTVDYQTARMLKDAGCYLVEIGIQSYSGRLREGVLGRSYDNSEVEKAIDGLKASGIKVICENIYGLPGENIADIKAALKFYASKSVSATFYGLRFYPKTSIIESAREEGLINTQDIEKINQGQRSTIFTHGGDSLTEDFLRINLWFLLTFLLPRKWLIRHIDRIFKTSPPRKFVVQLVVILTGFSQRPLQVTCHRVFSRLILYFNYSILKINYEFKKMFSKARS